MSTLVHVPDAMFDEALSEMVRVTRVDGLFAIGLWGGRDHEGVIAFEPERAGRFFSLRTEDRARSMLQDHGELTEFETLGRLRSPRLGVPVRRSPQRQLTTFRGW